MEIESGMKEKPKREMELESESDFVFRVEFFFFNFFFKKIKPINWGLGQALDQVQLS